MHYGTDLTKRICEELKKVPNIRHVCAKVGIDHSTFYRWMADHPTFHKEVRASLFFGREYITGAAEAVILKGVNSGDFRAASFWLTHNEIRYMQKDKGDHYAHLMQMECKIIKAEIPPNEITFEKLFELVNGIEKHYEFEYAWLLAMPALELFCRQDMKLIDIIKSTYLEWKADRKDLKQKVQNAEGFIPKAEKEEFKKEFD